MMVAQRIEVVGTNRASSEVRNAYRMAQMQNLEIADLEIERHAIAEAVPSAIAIWGAQDLEEREQRVADFSDGKIKYLAAKPISR